MEGRTSEPAPVDLAEVVRELIKEGLSGKRLADEAHKRFGVRKGEAYDMFLEMTESEGSGEKD